MTNNKTSCNYNLNMMIHKESFNITKYAYENHAYT